MFEKVDTSTPLGRVQMFRLRQSVNRYEISILTAYFCVTVHTNLATPFLSVLCNKDFFFSPAISQRDPSACYHYLSAHKETIRHEVASFFQKNIAGKFPNKNCKLCFIKLHADGQWMFFFNLFIFFINRCIWCLQNKRGNIYYYFLVVNKLKIHCFVCVVGQDPIGRFQPLLSNDWCPPLYMGWVVAHCGEKVGGWEWGSARSAGCWGRGFHSTVRFTKLQTTQGK